MTVVVTKNISLTHIIGFFFYGVWNLFSGFYVLRPVHAFVFAIKAFNFKMRQKDVTC
uniref:Uncharacterized protein n=1 Tax=Solanum lycopersicum TaxID=4081 RepID=K4BSW7_SOLLC